MFKDSMIIFKKEMKNIFKDKRSFFSIIILPFILMPIIFGTIGFVSNSQEKGAQETTYILQIKNAPEEFKNILSQFIKFEETQTISEEGNFAALEFPQTYNTDSLEKINVKVLFRSTSQKSSFALGQIKAALNAYQSLILQKNLEKHGLSLDDLKPINVSEVDIAPKESQGTQFLSMMVPYMLLIYIFAGAMGIGMDTTSGEKERGGLAALLVNQVSRTSIAIGKILYVIVTGLLNSVSTFGGLIVGIALIGNFSAGSSELYIPAFSAFSILGLLFTILSMSAVAASMIILMGSFARNVKEASGYIMPVYIIAIVVGVATMNMDFTSSIGISVIPLIGSVFSLKGLLSNQISLLQVLLSIFSNFAVSFLFAYVTAKLFNSEKIMNTVG